MNHTQNRGGHDQYHEHVVAFSRCVQTEIVFALRHVRRSVVEPTVGLCSRWGPLAAVCFTSCTQGMPPARWSVAPLRIVL